MSQPLDLRPPVVDQKLCPLSDGLLRQVKSEDLEAFGLIPEIIGRLLMIAPWMLLAWTTLLKFFWTVLGLDVH